MAKSGFKRTNYGSYYIESPSGEKIYIDKSDDQPGMWQAQGQYYDYLKEAKSAILESIKDIDMNSGGLATKNYVNPVTITDNRKKK